MQKEDFAEACPVCRNNCNCKDCLRLFGPTKVGLCISNQLYFMLLAAAAAAALFLYDLSFVICLQHLKDLTLKFNDETKIQYSEYMLQMLLPFLKRFHEEQLAEKETEAKIHGIFSKKLIRMVGNFL